MNVMNALGRYARVFTLHYKVYFMEYIIKGLVEDKMASMFLPTRSSPTYIRCGRFAKYLSLNEQFLPCLENLSKETGMGKTWGYRVWTGMCCMGPWTKTLC